MTFNPKIRVRFAPSPTGYLHVGGLRTALYNYLFAKKLNGIFILRIEDTDRARFVEGAVKNLIETLTWAGLEYDEGPGKEGAYGPYVQSERLAIYHQHVDQLLKDGNAYKCFCTPERLTAMKEEQKRSGLSSKYDGTCLKLSSEHIASNLQQNIPYVVRMKIPVSETIRFQDIVRGDVEFASEQVDDQVLLKSDGYPTYHLANVADDHLMKISHVIRGEEWLSSTPKHVLLYRYFNWETPVFAHLPLLLNSDRSKLSKRQGDVAVEDYKSKGYLKEALVNFVALLGWNPGTEQEIFSLNELIEQFSLERVNKSGAIFNLEKLDWLNEKHLRAKSDSEILVTLKKLLLSSKFKGLSFKDEYLISVIHAMRERIRFVKDLVETSPYFFEAPDSYDQAAVKKGWKHESPAHMKKLAGEFSLLVNPQKEDFEKALQKTAEELKISNGALIHPTRLAISGVGGGPGLYDILAILGRDESMKRIHTAIERLK